MPKTRRRWLEVSPKYFGRNTQLWPMKLHYRRRKWMKNECINVHKSMKFSVYKINSGQNYKTKALFFVKLGLWLSSLSSPSALEIVEKRMEFQNNVTYTFLCSPLYMYTKQVDMYLGILVGFLCVRVCILKKSSSAFHFPTLPQGDGEESVNTQRTSLTKNSVICFQNVKTTEITYGILKKLFLCNWTWKTLILGFWRQNTKKCLIIVWLKLFTANMSTWGSWEDYSIAFA